MQIKVSLEDLCQPPKDGYLREINALSPDLDDILEDDHWGETDEWIENIWLEDDDSLFPDVDDYVREQEQDKD